MWTPHIIALNQMQSIDRLWLGCFNHITLIKAMMDIKRWKIDPPHLNKKFDLVSL